MEPVPAQPKIKTLSKSPSVNRLQSRETPSVKKGVEPIAEESQDPYD